MEATHGLGRRGLDSADYRALKIASGPGCFNQLADPHLSEKITIACGETGYLWECRCEHVGAWKIIAL